MKIERSHTAILAFCVGSILLCFFATFQKMVIGAPLVLKGYFVPFFFGGTAGLLLGIWIFKLQEARLALQKFNDELEVRIDERTLELKNEVDKRKQIQRDLQDSEKLLKEAQIIGKLGHWELTFETGKLEWSDEIYRIFGLQPQEFKATYEAFLKKIHPEDTRKVDSIFKKSVEKQTEYQVEHRILLKDESEKWVLEKGYTEYNEGGEPVRSIGIVQDITEIKLLRGILPICAYCKKIKNDEGTYEQIESYVHKHSGANFTHTICPTCMQDLYPEACEKINSKIAK